ncbi:MAG: alpha-glucosidase [Bacilli bacterium]|nr:alpha-glucosidase [Bacilli bacterium]
MKRTEWYKNAVVYQIYPFSFKDNNNDGWGDIEGIISKIDYLAELGITAIWFSPLYKSPDYDYGYDISDYKDIDPKFGTLDDFKRMLKLCHEKNIKVIMDMAINHSSIEHKWFKEAIKDSNSPYRDYYIIREGKKKGKKLLPPNNWDSTFTGSAWKNIEGTDDFYLHLFCVEQADLNWENPKVRDEAVDIFNFWLELGVDGFRLDVFNMFSKVYPLKDAKKKIAGTGSEYYVDGPRIHEYLHDLNKRAFSKYDSFTVGESYMPSEKDAKQYVDKDSEELDTIFNFAHFNSDNNTKYFKKKFNLIQFKNGLFEPQVANFGTGWNTLVLENHDCTRSNSRFGINVKKYHYEASTFLPLVTFLGFGTPFMYMGEEFGMTNVKFNNLDECKDPVTHFIVNLLRKFGVPKKCGLSLINDGLRDQARVPMRWDDSINNGFNEGATPWQCSSNPLVDVSLEKDLKSDKSIFKFYQQVIKFKKENTAAINGAIKEYNHKNKRIIAYTRLIDNKGYFVFGNFSNRLTTYQIPSVLKDKLEKVLLHNYTDGHINDKLTLRPYEAFVVEMN